ncbi:MAG: hypothetical protein ACH36H_10120, partial [Candidatus Nanopelagicales bacterium]
MTDTVSFGNDPQPTARAAAKRLAGLLVLVALVAISLLAGTLLAPAPASAAAAVSGPAVGVQFHGTWGDYTDAQRARVLDTLKANGATTVRIDV